MCSCTTAASAKKAAAAATAAATVDVEGSKTALLTEKNGTASIGIRIFYNWKLIINVNASFE